MESTSLCQRHLAELQLYVVRSQPKKGRKRILCELTCMASMNNMLIFFVLFFIECFIKRRFGCAKFNIEDFQVSPLRYSFLRFAHFDGSS